jgi:anaerobic magnesium-protoporphyrin IX monomethyl ester cyclase
MSEPAIPSAPVTRLSVRFGPKQVPELEQDSATAVPPAIVTLIRPPVLQIPVSFSSYGAMPPIGLAYIAAVLRDAGHHVRLIDGPGEALTRFTNVPGPAGTLQLNGLTAAEIVDRVDPATEIVGITHMFLHEWPTIRDIAERLKVKIPGAAIVIGGENATGFWPWIFESTDAVDYCVLGEGEATMLELVARLKTGRSTADLPGIASRAGKADAPAQLSGRMTNLEAIPRPAWEYTEIESYMSVADNHGVNRGRSIPMMATRGCPYQCTFCSSPSMWTTKYVLRTPEDVVDELRSYVERYRVSNVNFCDLTVVIRREWTIAFCQLMIRENVGVTWQLPSGTRSEALDAEVLELMYDAGCRNITYAPESGSERMLNVIKKKVKLPKMLESLRAAERQGLRTRVSVIIGHPEERRVDTWQSLKLLMKTAWVGCHDASVMIFSPYPGSEDFRRLVDSGRLQVSENYYYVALSRGGRSSSTYNPQMGKRELFCLQLAMLLAFYGAAYLLRPWRLLRLVSGLMTGAEENAVHQTIRTKIRQFRSFRHARARS